MTKELSEQKEEFAKLAQERRASFIREFWHFLKHNKKWWLLPILLVFLLLGIFVLLAGTPLAPFIYTIF